MHPDLYAQVYSIQTNHWWGRNRRKLSFDLLKRFGAKAECRHLDIGCGTGQNLRLLDDLRPTQTVGIDVSPIALGFARNACPRCQLVCLDLNQRLPFPDKSFDVATIFNVLYHAWIKSELAVLEEARRVLKSDGLLLITEPAFPILARDLDVAVMAARRYRLKSFMNLLRAADFDVLFANYLTSFGAPIILAMKAMAAVLRKPSRAEAPPDIRSMSAPINAVLYGLSRIEAGLVKASIPMPFGTTIICVARTRAATSVSCDSGMSQTYDA